MRETESETELALAPGISATALERAAAAFCERRAANELLFPIGCAFVLYVAEAFGRQASAPRR